MYVSERGKETEKKYIHQKWGWKEILHYGETLRQIREYEEVFEDKLEDDVKIQLLGYQMNCTETINIKQNDYVNEKDFYHARCLLVMNFIVVICSHI